MEHGVPISAYSDTLSHHGIKGQKWGVRRYRNFDGTLTTAGKRRYSSSSSRRKNDLFEKMRVNRERRYAARNAYKLDDAELEQRVRRLQKEQQLRNLTYDSIMNSSSPVMRMMMSNGQKIVSLLLMTAVTGGIASRIKTAVTPSSSK